MSTHALKEVLKDFKGQMRGKRAKSYISEMMMKEGEEKEDDKMAASDPSPLSATRLSEKEPMEAEEEMGEGIAEMEDDEGEDEENELSSIVKDFMKSKRRTGGLKIAIAVDPKGKGKMG